MWHGTGKAADLLPRGMLQNLSSRPRRHGHLEDTGFQSPAMNCHSGYFLALGLAHWEGTREDHTGNDQVKNSFYQRAAGARNRATKFDVRAYGTRCGVHGIGQQPTVAARMRALSLVHLWPASLTSAADVASAGSGPGVTPP